MARFMRSYGKSRLGKPIVVGAVVVPALSLPVVVRLARRPPQYRAVQSRFTATPITHCAFPSTPILTTGNGPSTTPPGNWTGPILFPGVDVALTSGGGQITSSVAGTRGDGNWQSTYGPNVEVYAEIVSLAAAVSVEITNGSGFYSVQVAGSGSTIAVAKSPSPNVSQTTILTIPVSPSLGAGDAFGFRCFNNDFEVWVRRSGVWRTAGNFSDSTYQITAGAQIGFIASASAGTNGAITNFGGGNACGTSPTPFTRVELAPSRRGRPLSHLGTPQAVFDPVAFGGPGVRLASISNVRIPVQSDIKSPAVVGAGITFRGLLIKLVLPVNRRQIVRWRLSPPTVLTSPPIPAPISVKIAYSRRGKPVSKLRLPQVVFDPIAFGGPGVRLSSISNARQIVQSNLVAPVVVTQPAPAALAAPVSVRIVRVPPLRKAKSHLSAPTVVSGGIAYRGPGTKLAPPINRRSAVRHVLAPPTVLTANVQYAPVSTHLAYSRRGKPRFRLSPPVVVASGIAYRGPGVKLVAPINRRAAVRHVLGAPVVVVTNAPFAPVATHLAYFRRGKPRIRLAPPVVVAGAVAFRGPGVRLTNPANRRPSVRHFVAPPTVVTIPAAPAALAVRLAYSRRGRPRSRLTLPVVVAGSIAYFGPGVKLAATPNRRQSVRHLVITPAVVIAAALAAPARIHLSYSRRGAAKARLAAPVVVAGSIVYHGPGVRLAAPANTRRPVRHALAPPAVVGTLTAFHGPGIRLFTPRSTRPKVAAKLAAPTVVFPPALTSPPRVALAASKRGRPRTKLAPPAVVAGAITFHGPGVKLVAPLTTRRPVRHVLAPPTVLAVTYAFHGPGVRLAGPIDTRQPVRHRLAAPTVVAPPLVFAPVQITLAPQRRGTPVATLSAPTAVAAGLAFHGPRVRLFNPAGRRDAVKHTLRAPAAVTAATIAQPIRITIARGKPGRPLTALSAPSAVLAGIAFHGPRVKLAGPINTRAKVRHTLAAPAAVRADVFAPVKVTLADSHRGAAKPKLNAPAIIGDGVTFGGPSVLLAPSNDIPQRRRPDSKLRPPVVIQPLTLLFFGPDVTRAASKRGRPTSHLAPPAVIGAGVTYGPVAVQLAYSRRGAPLPFLAPPAVVGVAPFRGLDITLAPSRRPRTQARLAAPAVVGQSPFRPVAVTLSRIRPARTRTILRAPAAVRFPPFRPVAITVSRIRPAAVHSRVRPALLPPPTLAQSTITLTLAPSRRPTRFWKLRPPARVGPGIVFRPVQTHVVRITHPPVNRMLGAPTAIITVSPCRGYISDFPPYGGHIEDHTQTGGHVVDAVKAGGMIQDMSTSAGLVTDTAPGTGTVSDRSGT